MATMGARTGEFLLSEAPGTLSREAVVIASGAGALAAGTVLGKVTASGKYIAYDDDNSDGSQAATGVLLAAVDATSADQDAVMIARLAEVADAKLVWASTNDAGDITAGKVDLAALNIIVRS